MIHHNQKNRFEVQPKDGIYLARACQGHSVSHVRDELLLTALSVRDTPEYAAHGTFCDFYESILRQGLVAGGQQGQSFRRHVRVLEKLPCNCTSSSLELTLSTGTSSIGRPRDFRGRVCVACAPDSSSTDCAWGGGVSGTRSMSGDALAAWACPLSSWRRPPSPASPGAGAVALSCTRSTWMNAAGLNLRAIAQLRLLTNSSRTHL